MKLVLPLASLRLRTTQGADLSAPQAMMSEAKRECTTIPTCIVDVPDTDLPWRHVVLCRSTHRVPATRGHAKVDGGPRRSRILTSCLPQSKSRSCRRAQPSGFHSQGRLWCCAAEQEGSVGARRASAIPCAPSLRRLWAASSAVIAWGCRWLPECCFCRPLHCRRLRRGVIRSCLRVVVSGRPRRADSMPPSSPSAFAPAVLLLSSDPL